MVTKEQCEQALRNLETIDLDIVLDELGYEKAEMVSWYGMNDYPTLEKQGDIDVLRELIEEHFSNPPLKFEELKEGMWVWDNKYKYYFECNPRISTDMTECVWYESFWYNTGEGYDEFYEDYIEFEENRFYRKKVKE